MDILHNFNYSLFSLKYLSASPQTLLGAGTSTGTMEVQTQGRRAQRTQLLDLACASSLSLSLSGVTHGHWKTQTPDLKCVLVVLHGILAVQKVWSSSTPLGCMERGKAVVLLESSAGASFITAWEVVAECLTIVLIYETHVRTVEYTCGLVCTLPCHFFFSGRQMQGR